MTLVNFYETDFNKVPTVQSPTLISTTVSHACADPPYTVRASARVYQLSLYKAKTTTDVPRDLSTVAINSPEITETYLYIGKEL